MSKILVLVFVMLGATSLFGQTPAKANLAPTPPMGWNSWNKFGCKIDEKLIRETADAMVSSGMKEAGYVYLNIDDCWMADKRDASGKLESDPTRFPGGIKALADYVHSKGLKIGIYATPGSRTCGNIWNDYPGKLGSLGHEQLDADTFAAWGVDYLKYDWCRADEDGLKNQAAFTVMHNALKRTGRPIVFSIHDEPQLPVPFWRPQIANLWRTTSDIRDNWQSVMSLLDRQVGLEKYSMPNAWNDPDMLEVGNGGMTDAEYRAHFSLWALLNAPLMAGNDLRTMPAATKEILTNKEVIAVNQDWGGKQGFKLRDDGDHEVWIKPMSDGSRAVVMLNRSGEDLPAKITVFAEELGMIKGKRFTARNLWTHTDHFFTNSFTAPVPAHNVLMFTVRRKK